MSFLFVDPLASEYPGWTPYAYVLNNPLRYNDPTGLCAELINASAGSYEGEAARDLFQQHCSGVEPAEQHQNPDKDPEQNKPTCIGLNCADAAATFAATIEIGLSQEATSANAHRLAGHAGLLRRGSTPIAIGIGMYSLYLDVGDPSVSKERVAYRAAGMVAAYGTPIYLGAKYGSAFGPKGTLIGTGIGVAFIGGEFVYDHRHVPGQTYQRERRNLMWYYNRFEHSLKHGINPFLR